MTPGAGLAGQRIAFTRPTGEGTQIAELLAGFGAELVEYAVLVIRAVEGEERRRAREAVGELVQGRYHGLLLTSQTAVNLLVDLSAAEGLDPATWRAEVFAVGAKTGAALRRHGVSPTVAHPSTSDGLLTTVRAVIPEPGGCRFLFPRARAGRLAVLRGLREDGAEVEALTLYDTLPVEVGAPLPPDIDWITFMSPSAVDVFVQRAALAPGTRVACIGPTTAAAARTAGLRVDAVPADQSVEAMLEAMAASTPG